MGRWIVILVTFTATALGGRAQAQGFSIGLGAGTVDPDGARRAVFLSAHARWRHGKNVVIEPEAAYWSRAETTLDVETTVRDASIGVNVLYRLRQGRRLSLLAGGGLGLHVVRSTFDIAGFDEGSDTELKQGLHLLAAVDLKVGRRLEFFGIARSDLVADLDQNKLYGGVRVRLD